jgi:prepilin-type N-terminal cleavage/methylation domain-containing protein
MKSIAYPAKQFKSAFTLVELLTVIAIIGILSALLLVVIPHVITAAKIRKAQMQMGAIATAIQSYETDYGHFPVSHAVQSAANPDFTYGGQFKSPTGTISVGTPISTSIMSNSDVIAVLMNFTNYPGTATPTINLNGQANPKREAYLAANMPGDTSSPGVGTDLVYRDPWGNPYVISLDLNDDGVCEDNFYKTATVSGGGINGLILQPDGNYGFHGKIMVWSAGPDGQIDPNSPANQGGNKDNVLSWR